jgi:hypothetical protein
MSENLEVTNGSASRVHPVERGVPLPPVRTKAAPKQKKPRESRYPFNTMEAGDSFLITGASIAKANSVATMARKKYPGTKWATRATLEGVRIWRLV